MRFIKGFEEQIVEALGTKNSDIYYQAVLAAGNWDIKAAWPHVVALISSDKTPKPLLLAAIEAVPSIRPEEAPELLTDFTDSDDEDIVEAAYEALAMAEGPSGEDEDDEDDVFVQ
ncbi:MAG: HEAT repeat domain-containing protein [Myxococcaceae bacterium]